MTWQEQRPYLLGKRSALGPTLPVTIHHATDLWEPQNKVRDCYGCEQLGPTGPGVCANYFNAMFTFAELKSSKTANPCVETLARGPKSPTTYLLNLGGLVLLQWKSCVSHLLNWLCVRPLTERVSGGDGHGVSIRDTTVSISQPTVSPLWQFFNSLSQYWGKLRHFGGVFSLEKARDNLVG